MVLGIGRSSQAEADWPAGYYRADVTHADLSGIIGEFAPDVILHAAGTASVRDSLTAPLEDLRAAVMTWANILEGIRRSSLRPVIFFPSSAAVFGNPAELPIGEDAPLAPISPYGFHKLSCELLAREYASCFGFDVIVGRFFSIIGSRQRRLLLWELYEQFVGPAPVVWLQGTGEESRDFLAVDDAASAIFELAGHERRGQGGQGRCLIVNVASGQETRIRELAGLLRTFLKSEKEIRCRGEVRIGDPRNWCADISLLHSIVPTWHPCPLSLALQKRVAAWQAAA
jgi:UDP-glucose 4-epimerase